MITQDSPIIVAIENTSKLLPATKLTVLAAIDVLSQIRDDLSWFNENAKDVDELFEWYDSDLGVEFWGDIQDKVFGHKRTC